MTMDVDEKNMFLDLSQTLTGVRINSAGLPPPLGEAPRAKPGDLAPRNSPIDLASLYFDTVQVNGFGSVLDTALKEYSAHAVQDRNSYVRGCLLDPKSAQGALFRSLIKLWYLGVWYPPSSILALSPDETTPEAKPGWRRWRSLSHEVVSSQAYKEGLVWKIMQTHPMAYSMFTFGYWSEIPPPLDRFLSTL